MPFDPSTATPHKESFDPSTAVGVAPEKAPEHHSWAKPFGDVPRDVWTDIEAGARTTGEAVKENFTTPGGSMAAALKGLVGAGEAAMAPLTGTARALIGDPARAVIPQDTVYGKMAANALEDAGTVFGPQAAEKLASSLAAQAGPIRRLMENGVQLTLGQLEPRFARRMEEAAKSVPILGSFIRSAEGRAVDSFNVATVNKALEPLGIRIDAKDGRSAIQAGQDALNTAYRDVLGKVPSLHQDADFDNAITALKSTSKEWTPSVAERVNAVLDNRVYQRFGQLKAMNGEMFKTVESELTNISSSAKASADAAERQFGHAIDDVRSAMRDALGRQYPMLADKLTDINHAFSRFADVERAASTSAVSGGRFTPGQLLQSIKRADKSPRDKQFAAGNRPLQDWGEDAYSVIGNKLPDSGTTERALWDVGAGGGLFFVNPKILAGVGAGSLPYTKVGQSGVNAVAREAPDLLRAAGTALGQSGPIAGAAQSERQSDLQSLAKIGAGQ